MTKCSGTIGERVVFAYFSKFSLVPVGEKGLSTPYNEKMAYLQGKIAPKRDFTVLSDAESMKKS